MPEPLPSDDVLLPDPRRRRLVFGIALVGLLVYGALDVIPRAAAPTSPIQAPDLAVYLAAGRAVAAGASPYDIRTPMNWPYLYPPAFAILIAPLASLPPVVPAIGFFAANVLALAGLYRQTVRLSSRLRLATGEVAPVPLVRAAAVSALVFGLGPTLQCLRQGQVAVFLLWLCLWALGALLSAPSWAVMAGVALSLAVAIKLTPILPAVAMLAVAIAAARPATRVAARQAIVGLVLGLTLFFGLLPLAVTGPARTVVDLRDFAVHVVANRDLGRLVIPFWGNYSAVPLAEWAMGTATCTLQVHWSELWAGTAPLVPGGGAAVTVAGVAIGLAIVLLLALACRRLARTGDDLSISVALGLALAAMILAQPLSWSHMLLLFGPAILFTPPWLWRHGRGRAAWWAALSPAALVALHYASKLGQRPFGWRGPYLLAWFAMTAWAVAGSRLTADPRPPDSPKCRQFPRGADTESVGTST